MINLCIFPIFAFLTKDLTMMLVLGSLILIFVYYLLLKLTYKKEINNYPNHLANYSKKIFSQNTENS